MAKTDSSKRGKSSVTASTLVLAALRERVAALHAAVELDTDEPTPSFADPTPPTRPPTSSRTTAAAP